DLLRRGRARHRQPGRRLHEVRRRGPPPPHVPHRGGTRGRVLRAGRDADAEAAQPAGPAAGGRDARRPGPPRTRSARRHVAPGAARLPGGQLTHRVLITAADLQAGVNRLATELADAYDDGLVLAAVLKGSVPFLADLVRRMTILAVVDFLAISHYAPDSGRVRILKDL